MIYVNSERAGQRVMASVTQYVEQRLKLKVNRHKSAVDRATERTLLGFRFAYRDDEVRVSVSPEAQARAKERVRRLSSRSWGISMERRIEEINRFTVGWTAYYCFADSPYLFGRLDKWLRRRLRQVRWKEWKLAPTRERNLRAQGVQAHMAHQWAHTRKGYWRVARSPVLQRALPNAYWTDQGLKGFTGPYHRLRDATRTAGCGPARPVVWEAPG